MLVNFNLEGLEEKDVREIKFLLQEINDKFESGITSRNLSSFRNIYVINAQDSLDASYPMYVHFNIIDEMIKIVSVKVDFWILNYRAYSKAAASGGGQTSSGSNLTLLSSLAKIDNNFFVYDIAGSYEILLAPSVNNIMGHTHTVVNHTHDLTYGIFEETNSPTIKFYVSENAGVSYSDVFGGYTIDKSRLDITSLLTKAGSKIIRFTSTTRTRLSVQITVKLDIKAR